MLLCFDSKDREVLCGVRFCGKKALLRIEFDRLWSDLVYLDMPSSNAEIYWTWFDLCSMKPWTLNFIDQSMERKVNNIKCFSRNPVCASVKEKVDVDSYKRSGASEVEGWRV